MQCERDTIVFVHGIAVFRVCPGAAFLCLQLTIGLIWPAPVDISARSSPLDKAGAVDRGKPPATSASAIQRRLARCLAALLRAAPPTPTLAKRPGSGHIARFTQETVYDG